MDIRYRLLTPGDEGFLWDIFYYAIYIPPGQPPLPREIVHQADLCHYVENWGKRGDFGLLALDGNDPVGAAWLRLFTNERRGYGFVNEDIPELTIALLPPYRNLGIGGSLLRQLLDAARSFYLAVCLSVTPGNPAQHLYERQGFKELEKPDPNSLTMLYRYQ